MIGLGLLILLAVVGLSLVVYLFVCAFCWLGWQAMGYEDAKEERRQR